MNYFKVMFDLYKLKRHTKMTKDQIKQLQNKKLRVLLHYVWEHSSYYRKTFEQAGITMQELDHLPLSSFPTIDKKMLLEHFDTIVTVPDLKQEEIRAFDRRQNTNQERFKGRYSVVHSSGSTGKPGYFVYDEAAWNSMVIAMIRAALWGMSMPQILKLLIKRPRIVYIAATDGRYGGAMAVGSGIDGVGASQMYLDIKDPIEVWIQKIKEFRPNIVIGYPSAIKILAELAERHLIEIKTEHVISCGEPLGKSLRIYLEEVFQTQVVNFYGTSESLCLGVETSQEEGMILFDDMNVIEVENGTMYITSLYNFAQPLIRYQLSDRIFLQAPEEADKYPFTKAKGLLGRNEDILWFEDGNGNREFLHPLAIEGFCIEGLLDYQFRQTAKDAFEMEAEISAKASGEFIKTEMLKQMRAILNEKQLEYVQFYVRFVTEILPNQNTGKKQLVIRS